MPATVVQAAENGNSFFVTTVDVTFTGVTTAGNLVLVRVEHYGATNFVSSVSDNKGNSYWRAGDVVRNADHGDRNYELWYAYDISGGSSHKITVVLDAVVYLFVVYIMEAAGFSDKDPYDQWAGVSVAGFPDPFNWSFGTLTPRGPNALVFMSMTYAFNIDATPAGWLNYSLTTAVGVAILATPVAYAADFSGAFFSAPVTGILGIFLADGLPTAWVDIPNWHAQEWIDASRYPGGVARCLCELWSEDTGASPGPTIQARLVSLLADGNVDTVVGTSAEITATVPTDATFSVTLTGHKRYKLQLTSDTPETDLFCAPGAKVVP